MSGSIGLEPRHASRIAPHGDCWIWTGNSNKRGYGLACINHVKMKLAHRLVYEALVRPLEPGEVLHHLCDVKLCVNPEHLEPMTRREHARLHPSNAQKNWERLRARTCCSEGHELTEENTRRRGRHRICRTCQRERSRIQQRVYRARRKEESSQDLSA